MKKLQSLRRQLVIYRATTTRTSIRRKERAGWCLISQISAVVQFFYLMGSVKCLVDEADGVKRQIINAASLSGRREREWWLLYQKSVMKDITEDHGRDACCGAASVQPQITDKDEEEKKKNQWKGFKTVPHILTKSLWVCVMMSFL